MKIIDKVNEDIKEAMRSRDQTRLNTLRMLKSKVLAVDARANLSDADVVKIFKTYFKTLEEALGLAQSANRADMVGQLEKELLIVQEYLPKSPSSEETKQIVQEAITKSGAKTKKDLGLVMKMIRQLNSEVDGKLAKELAEKLLTD